MKFAIRIVDGNGKSTLFAICEDRGGQVYRHYQLAKQSIEYGSSDWVTMNEWTRIEDWDTTYVL